MSWADWIKRSRKLAEEYGWTELKHKKDLKHIKFSKNGDKMIVYYKRKSVITQLNHPYRGQTELKRNDVGWMELERIFKNPRTHTDKGKYTSR